MTEAEANAAQDGPPADTADAPDAAPPATGGVAHVSRGRMMALLLLLAAAVSVVYINSLWGAFVFDDEPAIHRSIFTSDVGSALRYYFHSRRGFVHLTFALNREITGPDALGYHVVNLSIHVLATLTLFGLVRRTLTLPRLPDILRRDSVSLAFAIALLWGVHPLNTQAVTYIVQRMESLMGLMFLLTLYLTMRSATSARPIGWGIAAVVACWLGMATKEVMAVAPLVVLLYDRVFITGSFIRSVKERSWLYVALALSWLQLVAPSFVVGAAAHSDASAGFSVEVMTPMQYLLSQGQVILTYLWLSIWPAQLTVDWGWPPYQQLTAPLLLADAVVAAMVIAAFYGVWRGHWLGFLGLAFFFILAPTSSIMPVADLLMEHRMYVPLTCVITGLVIGGYLLLRRLAHRDVLRRNNWRPVGALLVLLIALALSARTVVRNSDYYSDVTLWQAAVRVEPLQPRAHHNLGSALQKAGRFDEAVVHYRRSIELAPQNPDAYNNLALMLLEHGSADEAQAMLQKAYDVDPDDPEVHYNLGLLHLTQNDLEQAQRWFRSALDIQPKYAAAWNNLAMTHLRKGEIGGAETAFSRAIATARLSEVGSYKLNLANLLLDLGRMDQAEQLFRDVARDDPTRRGDALRGLGNALARQGKLDAAADAFARSLVEEPDFTAVQRLARVHILRKQPQQAVQTYDRWLQQNPGDTAAMLDLAWLLATLPDDGARSGSRALTLATTVYQQVGASPATLDTLAAAHAEQDDFARAVEFAARAQQQLASMNQSALAQQVAQRLEAYRKNQPARTLAPRLPI